jgi:hypothetical protein
MCADCRDKYERELAHSRRLEAAHARLAERLGRPPSPKEIELAEMLLDDDCDCGE